MPKQARCESQKPKQQNTSMMRMLQHCNFRNQSATVPLFFLRTQTAEARVAAFSLPQSYHRADFMSAATDLKNVSIPRMCREIALGGSGTSMSWKTQVFLNIQCCQTGWLVARNSVLLLPVDDFIDLGL